MNDRTPINDEHGYLRIPVGNGANEESALARRLALESFGYRPQRFAFRKVDVDARGRWFVFEPVL